jgi:hypothetical protein
MDDNKPRCNSCNGTGRCSSCNGTGLGTPGHQCSNPHWSMLKLGQQLGSVCCNCGKSGICPDCRGRGYR